MLIRVQQEKRENLSPYAVAGADGDCRRVPEPPCDVRTAFQRDIDRIIHRCKAYRRLMHKTQVFLKPEGDHYRTRLTHTFEVSRIARTVARALRLNEDLTEAITLGHDLGHTPFGHSGETTLNGLMVDCGGFRHQEQSLRVVDILENNGNGLNLTDAVRDGILCHSGSRTAATLEGRLVSIADRIAYINHDIDDALRAGVLKPDELPRDCLDILGRSHSERVNTLARDVITASMGKNDILMSSEVEQAMLLLRTFLFNRVYTASDAKSEESKAQALLSRLFEYYVAI
jgi:dGTPase